MKVCILGRRIAELRKKRNLTQSDLANMIGKSTSTVAMWETEQRDPDSEMIIKLSEIFAVSSDYLLGLQSEEHEGDFDIINALPKKFINAVTQEEPKLEKQIINMLTIKLSDSKKLNDMDKGFLFSLCKGVVSKYYNIDAYKHVDNFYNYIIKSLSLEEKRKLNNVILDKYNIPIDKKYLVDYDDLMNITMRDNDESNSVAIPLLRHITPTESEVIGAVTVDKQSYDPLNDFALRIDCDSMIGDRIHKGDLVILQKQDNVDPNDIAIVSTFNQKAKIRRLKFEGNVCMLIPSNPSHSPDLVQKEHVHIYGKVAEVRFYL